MKHGERSTVSNTAVVRPWCIGDRHAGDRRKLVFDMPLVAWMERAAAALRLSDIPVTDPIARRGQSARAIHGDPCDRIMIATARALNCPLLTTDHKILAYAAAGHVRAIDARR